jgi:hypothetical protein
MLQRRPWPFKRQRLESSGQKNAAAIGFLSAITTGGHVSQSTALARAVVADVPDAPAGIKSVARWLSDVFGFSVANCDLKCLII